MTDAFDTHTDKRRVLAEIREDAGGRHFVYRGQRLELEGPLAVHRDRVGRIPVGMLVDLDVETS